MARIEDPEIDRLRVLVQYQGETVVDFDGQAWHVEIETRRPVYNASEPGDIALRWRHTGERIVTIAYRPADADAP